jgi:hypothetical protein
MFDDNSFCDQPMKTIMRRLRSIKIGHLTQIFGRGPTHLTSLLSDYPIFSIHIVIVKPT